MSCYNPHITSAPKTLNLVAEVSERLGRYAERTHKSQALRLRRANRIRTIQGSLAIEGNSLSGQQVLYGTHEYLLSSAVAEGLSKSVHI